jgi:hypothetical protein
LNLSFSLSLNPDMSGPDGSAATIGKCLSLENCDGDSVFRRSRMPSFLSIPSAPTRAADLIADIGLLDGEKPGNVLGVLGEILSELSLYPPY